MSPLLFFHAVTFVTIGKNRPGCQTQPTANRRSPARRYYPAGVDLLPHTLDCSSILLSTFPNRVFPYTSSDSHLSILSPSCLPSNLRQRRPENLQHFQLTGSEAPSHEHRPPSHHHTPTSDCQTLLRAALCFSNLSGGKNLPGSSFKMQFLLRIKLCNWIGYSENIMYSNK